MVEGARLESVYTSKAYQGFESLSLRHLMQSRSFTNHLKWRNASCKHRKYSILSLQEHLTAPGLTKLFGGLIGGFGKGSNSGGPHYESQ